MNTEAIKEIRKKAIIQWAARHNITVHKFLDEPENIESLEIFAEIVVLECLDQFNNADGDYDYVQYLIKNKFGLN